MISTLVDNLFANLVEKKVQMSQKLEKKYSRLQDFPQKNELAWKKLQGIVSNITKSTN